MVSYKPPRTRGWRGDVPPERRARLPDRLFVAPPIRGRVVAGGRGVGPPSSSQGVRGAVEPPPHLPLSAARRLQTSLAPAAASQLKASVKARKVENDLKARGQKEKLDAFRASQAMSVAKAQLKATQRLRVAAQRAKAIAADSRMFNPTPGPKTYYGTHAKIVPNSRGGFRFVLPHHVVPCVQRVTRKEVMFAKRLLKKGAGSRRRRWTRNSHIGC